jgi:hypothetical protein
VYSLPNVGLKVKDLPNADGAAIAELNEYFGIQAE